MSRTQLHSSATLPFEDGILPPARPASKRLSLMTAWLRATRPRQWTKNLLVFAAPAAAGSIAQPGVIARSVVAFFVVRGRFGLDLPCQRRGRPEERPASSGQEEPARGIGAAFCGRGIVQRGRLRRGRTRHGSLDVWGGPRRRHHGLSRRSVCSTRSTLKRVPLVELACVAAGFAFRAVAGGAVAHVTISPWFLMVASFGSLLIVAGKRSVEKAELQGSVGNCTVRHLRHTRQRS